MAKLELIEPDKLHSHEAVDPDQIRRIVEMMTRNGTFHPPLLVDSKTMVVLDGHHRLWASREMECERIPCYCVDYLTDASIVLESWRPDVTLTKRQVIDMGVSDEVFPHKTTRHRYAIPDSVEPTPLDELIE